MSHVTGNHESDRDDTRRDKNRYDSGFNVTRYDSSTSTIIYSLLFPYIYRQQYQKVIKTFYQKQTEKKVEFACCPGWKKVVGKPGCTQRK